MIGLFIFSLSISDPRIKNIPWNPVSNDLHDNMNCLEVISPVELRQVEYANDDSIQFWRNVLPMEFPEILAKTISSKDEL